MGIMQDDLCHPYNILSTTALSDRAEPPSFHYEVRKILFQGFCNYIQKFKRKTLIYHSIASSSPSPLMADVLKMAQVLLLRAERLRALDISDGVIAPSMSLGVE